jgi:hypothetical protein
MNLLKDLEMENAKTVIDLSNLTLEELNKVVYDANSIIRKKEYEAKEYRKTHSKEILKVSDIVSVTGDKFKGELFEVIKLNIKKVKCKRENGETWNIPYAHILMA